MMTWRLWQAVQRPPYRHPLFQRSISPRLTQITSPPDNRLLILFMIVSALFCCVFGTTQAATYIFVALFVPLMIAIPVSIGVLMFNGATYGIILTNRFSRLIARECANGRFDLIALLPGGALGASWILCLGVIYHARSMARINFQHTWVIRILPILIMSVYLYQNHSNRWDSNVVFIITTIYVLAQGIAFHIDDVQSVLLSMLVGMLSPLYFRGSLEARLMAVATYILLQILSYACILLLGFAMLPELYTSFHLNGVLTAQILLPILRLLIFYGVREGIIVIIWYILSRRLTADSMGEGLAVSP